MSFEQFKDKILYSRLKYRDKQAFIKAYDLYLDDIYRFLYFKVNSREEAEDLASQVFLKTWDYAQNKNLSDYKTLKSLLYKVARNLVIDQYRQKSRQQTISYDKNVKLKNTIDSDQDVHSQAETAIDFNIISQKLFELKDEYREVLTLRFVNEMSITEIAEALEKSKGNVRVLIYRALQALREMVKEE